VREGRGRENRESRIMVAREDWKIQLYVGTAAPGCPVERSSIASLPLSPAIES
jgi:hypothetical protein